MVTPHFQLKNHPQFGALLGQREADEGQLGPLALCVAAVGPGEQPWPFLLTITRS